MASFKQSELRESTNSNVQKSYEQDIKQLKDNLYELNKKFKETDQTLEM
jgi:hypothetical protein